MEKKRIQEYNVKLISSVEPQELSKSANDERFCLFDDVSADAASEAQRKSLREQREIDLLLKQRQNGVAPWRLGDGSFEASGQKPWYSRGETGSDLGPTIVRGKTLTGEAATEAVCRESTRKRLLDPMAALIYDGYNEVAESKESDEELKGKKHKGIHNRESKHKKKRKERHDITSTTDSDLRKMLRRKRLEREIFERKKASVILAKSDIYGDQRI